jgi:hypothetical protein
MGYRVVKTTEFRPFHTPLAARLLIFTMQERYFDLFKVTKDNTININQEVSYESFVAYVCEVHAKG